MIGRVLAILTIFVPSIVLGVWIFLELVAKLPN